MPATRLPRAIRRPILCTAIALSFVGCGGDEPEEGQPGTLRVARAVVKGLLTNSVEAEKKTPETPAPPAPAVARPTPEAWTRTAVAETCEVPYAGPVTIIPVRTTGAVRRSVADRPDYDLVYETDDTAIFGDGRVLTTNLEGVGTHLNAVGWSTNPMKILGAGVRPGGSSRNVGWNSASNTQNKGKKGKKRRRRRG